MPPRLRARRLRTHLVLMRTAATAAAKLPIRSESVWGLGELNE